MFGSEIGHNVAALEMYKMVLWRVERSAGDAAIGKFGRLTRFRNRRNKNGAHRLVLVFVCRKND